MAYFKAKARNSISAGSSPQPPLGELAALPDPLAAFKGPILVKEGRGERTGGKEKGRKRRSSGG